MNPEQVSKYETVHTMDETSLARYAISGGAYAKPKFHVVRSSEF